MVKDVQLDIFLNHCSSMGVELTDKQEDCMEKFFALEKGKSLLVALLYMFDPSARLYHADFEFNKSE